MSVRIRRIVETALDCDDLPRSAAFYTALLDATPMVSGDRLVALDAGEGTVLLLFQRGLSEEPVPLPGGLVRVLSTVRPKCLDVCELSFFASVRVAETMLGERLVAGTLAPRGG